MGMGAITWACLALTVHQGPARDYYLDSRDFEIPITINPSRRNEVQELTLYVSRDQGQTWELVAKKPPTERAFVYRAAADGPHWFVVQEEDRAHRLNPANPNRARPNQRIVVDTQKPQVRVTAERLPSGEVLARWAITEDHPDPQSLRLDYHTDAMRPDQWTPLPVEPLSGRNEKQFNPGNGGDIRIRVQIKDQAQNVGQGEATLGGTGTAPAPAPAVGAETPTFGVIPTVRAEHATPTGMLTSRQTEPRPFGDAPLAAPPDTTSSARPPVAPAAVAASSDRPPAPSETPQGALPPVRLVNRRDVKLEFEVGKIGPSGLSGAADVYVTVNEGATWSRLPNEVPVALPPLADAHLSATVHGSVTVQLPAEAAIYGFIVATKSKAGRARPAPKPGEAPQVRLELDATPPRAQLIRPMPDPNQRDTLLLSWTAVDRNLPSNPVNLEWAEQKDGPWNTIGGGPLPNSGGPSPNIGQFPWRLPERIPANVYLRLTVRDSAGNVAVAQTDKPELIDLSVPETNIIGVAPATR